MYVLYICIYIYNVHIVHIWCVHVWNPQTGSRPQSPSVPDTPQPHSSWIFLQDRTESKSARSPRPTGLASTEARHLWLKQATPSSRLSEPPQLQRTWGLQVTQALRLKCMFIVNRQRFYIPFTTKDSQCSARLMELHIFPIWMTRGRLGFSNIITPYMCLRSAATIAVCF